MIRHLRRLAGWCVAVTVLAYALVELELRNTATSGAPVQRARPVVDVVSYDDEAWL